MLFKKDKLFLCICIAIVVLSLLLTISFAGFQHEQNKFKTLLLTIFYILLLQWLLWDFIYFGVQALYQTFGSSTTIINKAKPSIVSDKEIPSIQIEYLQQRLKSLQAELQLTQEHRKEAQNIKYKIILNELWLYSKYFGILLFLLVTALNQLAYYNTLIVQEIVLENRISSFGLHYVHSLDDVYNFIQYTLVEAFNEGRDYDDQTLEESGWIHLKMAKLLGVVRLQQLRRNETHKIGLQQLKLTVQHFMPNWLLPYEQLPYINKYWRIYEPWLLEKHSDDIDNFLSSTQRRQGYLYNYPTQQGFYTVFLARNLQNSLNVLAYIRNNSWLDKQTAALFIDFTLYNADSNIFSICSVSIEQTAFGNFIWQLEVQSVELLHSLSNLSYIRWCVLMLYTLQFLQFVKALWLKVWQAPKSICSSFWNVLDFFIVLLNFACMVFIYWRELAVAQLLQRCERAKKLEFVDFRLPVLLNNVIVSLFGFLICLATVRLWKVLQFARVFRLHYLTLNKAKAALFSTTVFIFIIMFGFGLTSYIINGNNTNHFIKLSSSLISTMCFSFGLSSEVTPSDLTYGGYILGFILYTALMFAISIILLNLFVTIICSYFAATKELQQQLAIEQALYKLSFFQFLQSEYAAAWSLCQRLLKHCTGKKTINNTNKIVILRKSSQENLSNVSAERLHTIALVLTTQIEILNHRLNNMDNKTYFDDDDDNEADIVVDNDNSEQHQQHIEMTKLAKNDKPNTTFLSKSKRSLKDVCLYLGVYLKYVI